MKIAKNIIIGLLISFIILESINSISVNNAEFLETDKKHKKKNTGKAPELESAKIRKGTNFEEDAYAYNYDETEHVAKVNEDKIKVERSGVSPRYVKSLPGNTNRYINENNEKVSPEFLKDEGQKKDYYDGLDNLSARTANNNCTEYSGDEQTCLSQNHCGICDDNNMCVPGGKSGPFVACKTFRYFSNPKQN